MKKEIVSALSAEPSIQKGQRAPIPSRGPVAAEPKSRPSRGRANPATNAPNGKSNGGGKQEKSSLPPRAEIDANSVLSALIALKKGDFAARLPVGWTGIGGKVADTFNDVAELMAASTMELSRISRLVGQEGRIHERLAVGHVFGAWSERVNSVNTLIDCLAHPVSETARVIGAVAKGDLSQSMALEIDGRKLEGEFLRTAKTVNTMVNQLGAFCF